MCSYLAFDLFCDLRILSQEDLCILSSLANLAIIVGEPCTALLDDTKIHCQIQDVTLFGDSLSEHDIKFCFFKRRCHFILHDFDTGTVTDHFSTLFDRLGSSDIHTHGSVELQGTSTGGCLRITEHDTDLFTQLVDKDHDTVGLAYHTGQFSQCLRHQSCLQTHMGISHISLDLCFRYQGCYRVHDDDVHRTGTHHCLSDLECLFSVIRL